MNFNFLDSGVLIYTIFFFFSIILYVINFGKENNEVYKSYVLLVIIYIFIGGFRSQFVGSDTGTYVFFFDYLKGLSYPDVFYLFSSRDPFAFSFFKFISEPYESYTPALFIIHSIISVLVALTYYKYSDKCLLALLLFFFLRYHFFVISGIKQGLALSIVLYSYRYIKNPNLLKFASVIVVASLFHASSILCLIIYPIRNLKIYNSNIKLILVIVITFLFTLYTSQIGSLLFSKKTGYLIESEEIGNIFSLISSTLVFLYIHFSSSKIELNEEQNTLYNISLLFFLFSIMSFKLELAFRMAMYFGFFVPILFTSLTTTRRLSQFVVTIMIILYIITGVPKSVNPYQPFWDKTIIDKTIQ